MGVWIPIGSTRHCCHQWPIVPAPGDYDDGEIGGMIRRGNRSTQRKTAPVPLCPPQTPHAARNGTRAAAVLLPLFNLGFIFFFPFSLRSHSSVSVSLLPSLFFVSVYTLPSFSLFPLSVYVLSFLVKFIFPPPRSRLF
jgi:hypothetical protein